jgi:hypothetical protein
MRVQAPPLRGLAPSKAPSKNSTHSERISITRIFPDEILTTFRYQKKYRSVALRNSSEGGLITTRQTVA